MHSGALAPGMNTAVRAALRIGLDRGHQIIGIRNGFDGLITRRHLRNGMDECQRLGPWVALNWAPTGKSPAAATCTAIARAIEEHKIDGLLIIGGWTAYESAFKLHQSRNNYPAFNLPIVLLPASINNNLPGSELSVGADTALNNIVEAVDKIKDSATALRRCFVVEVMGRYCGYLALMSGLATGAERVYIDEEGVL